MTDQTIVIEPDGTIRFVYSDELAEVFTNETMHTTRASNVEPHPTRNGWIADMSPVGGPVLGSNGTFDDMCAIQKENCLDDWEFDPWDELDPFTTRQAALDAEREWLRKERGL